MARVQLALNVSDIDAAVDFYRRLFNTEPAKRRPGYANFAIADPPLKLVLMQYPDAAGTMNHIGVEVTSTEEVNGHASRLRGEGLRIVNEDGVTCCHAVQDKVWVSGPDELAWEIYTVLADAPVTPACCGTSGTTTPA